MAQTAIIWRSTCAVCKRKVTWVGVTGNPPAPKKGEHVICLTCLVFGQKKESEDES